MFACEEKIINLARNNWNIMADSDFIRKYFRLESGDHMGAFMREKSDAKASLKRCCNDGVNRLNLLTVK
jgi:hypothetical protein